VHVDRFFAEIYDRELEVYSISSELYAVWMGAVCDQVDVYRLTSPVACHRLSFLDVVLMSDQDS
jgi:hypothetical protein